MFKVNSYHKTDYFGVGLEVAIQYQWLDDKREERRPAGIVLTLNLFTKVYDIGLWW